MASYLVWHGKKRATFQQREAELITIINDGGPREHVLRAAIALRDAKIRYLNSEHSRLDLGDGRYARQIAKLETTIEEWSSKPAEAIVEEFRRKNRPGPKGDS